MNALMSARSMNAMSMACVMLLRMKRYRMRKKMGENGECAAGLLDIPILRPLHLTGTVLETPQEWFPPHKATLSKTAGPYCVASR